MGESGTVLRHDGHAWVTVPTGVTEDLHDVHVLASDDVWVVGLGATVGHWDGTSWTWTTWEPRGELWTVWALGPDDVLVGGYGALRHLRSGAWTTVSLPATTDGRTTCVLDSWGVDGRYWVSVVDGRGSAVLAYDGTILERQWDYPYYAVTRVVTGLSGRAVDDVWGGGASSHADSTNILRFDGARWSMVDNHVPFDVGDLLVTAAGGIRAVGGRHFVTRGP